MNRGNDCKLPTRTVIDKASKQTVIINESDYNPELHGEVEAPSKAATTSSEPRRTVPK